MVHSEKDLKLDEWDDEDVFDVVAKLEKAFGLKFDKNAFYNVKTFGDLCDIFENHIAYEHIDDCTTQQAFYRVRKAISVTQNIDPYKIKADTQLSELFPHKNRRLKAKEFKRNMGMKVKILTYPGWLLLVLIVGFCISLFTIGWNWKISLSAATLFIFALKVDDKLGMVLQVKTIRELAQKIAREQYLEVRRKKNSVNRKEISEIIIDAFSNDLSIDKAYLTRESKFSWALEKEK